MREENNNLHEALKAAGNEALNRPGEEEASAFVHLHLHSAYSLLEGALSLHDIISLAIADGQPAIAITDRNNLFGALEFSQKAAGKGLQPIMGCKLAVNSGDGHDHNERSSFSEYPFVVLLACSEQGFANLRILVSRAHLNVPEREAPNVGMADLHDHADGLICLSGGDEGPLNKLLSEGRADDALSRFFKFKEIFGNRFYLELQRHAAQDMQVEKSLLQFAYEYEVPLVATNQPYFARREDYESHDALLCIAQGAVIPTEDRHRVTPEHCFKSAAQMRELFVDLPEAIENTIEIARRCSYRDVLRPPILPRFAKGAENSQPHEAIAAESVELKKQAREGLENRLATHPLAEGFSRVDYDARLDFELDVIEQMRYPGYFLIVADFIKWAKDKGIPVGPGRGSGAGSLVAWSLTITDIDPLRFSLLFERFLNPERISMPDFDIDFCQERREEVIRYVQEKYGHGQVAQIITFGTLQARAVLRDVGRVLQMPYGQVDRLCKMIPNNPANPTTLAEAIKGEPRLQDAAREEEIVAKLFDISRKLEGLFRHASTHAAGIVIGDRELDRLVPLYRDPRSNMPVTQYNMKWVEQAGLVKFDFLGLKTLTVLQKAIEFIEPSGTRIDLSQIPLDDKKTFEMLTRGETVGVFQLESQGMRSALVGMKPDRLEDIIALVALYRPGPMENIPTYNRRKHGGEKPDYYDDKIASILEETYGVIIYQEQVMQIAQILSGYSLGEADMLRRAMGKKIAAEMEAQRTRFVDGALERGVASDKARDIFDLLAKFANYGFNKSHAAAYALVSYQTAYLKANYPVEFLAGSMQLDMGNTDKLAIFCQEVKARQIKITAPSVQTSGAGFDVKEGEIYYALAAIKGVGEAAVSDIVKERKANGQYKSIEDFFSRIDVRQINKRTLENLICAGALDCFGYSRERMIAGLDRLVSYAVRSTQGRETGQNDIFGGIVGEALSLELPACETWSNEEKLSRELQSVGFYLSAHPLDDFRTLMEKRNIQTHDELKTAFKDETVARLAGVVVARQERKTRNGKPMGIVVLSDASGQYEAIIFEEALNRFRDVLSVGHLVTVQVGVQKREEELSIRINHAELLEKAVASDKQHMTIFIRDEQPIPQLKKLLGQQGKGTVSIIVLRKNGAREVEVALKGRYVISSSIKRAIQGVAGVEDVALS